MAFLKKLSSLRKRKSLLPGKKEAAGEASTSTPSTLAHVEETATPTTSTTHDKSRETQPTALSQQSVAPQQSLDAAAEAHGKKAQALHHKRLAFAQASSSPPQLAAALASVDAALRLDPGDGMAWKLKGIVHQAGDDYEQAHAAYAEAAARLEGAERQAVQSTLHLIALLRQAQQAEAAKQATVALPSASTPAPATALVPQVQATAPVPPVQLGQVIPHATPGQAGFVPDQSKPILLEPPSSSSATHPLLEAVHALGHPKSMDLLVSLTRRARGALYLVEFNGIGSVDQVALFFLGKSYSASQGLDMARQAPAMHPAWEKSYWRGDARAEGTRFSYNLDSLSLPGNDVFDFDVETLAACDGLHAGTASVRGFGEAWRVQQGSLPRGHAALEVFSSAQTWAQQLSVRGLVDAISSCARSSSLEAVGAAGLDESIITYATTGQGAACASVQLSPPSFLTDVRTLPAYSSNIASITAGASLGLHKFLQHVLVGELAALLIRALSRHTRCPKKVQVSPALCALACLSRLWREHVAVRPSINGGERGDLWNLVPNHAQLHAEGLVRFAEALGWPRLPEACAGVNEILGRFTADMFGSGIHPYLLDWLLGLVLPGRYFRARIMSCLVLAAEATRGLGSCPSWDSGLVLAEGSYWPKLTVLGRVLSSLDRSTVTCGWVRPLPAPRIQGVSSAWAKIDAQPVSLAPPLSKDGPTYLEACDFSREYSSSDPRAFPADLASISRWTPPRSFPPPRPSSLKTSGGVELETVHLSEVPGPGDVKTYTARLDFSSHGAPVSFTLRHNPLFVHVPSCEGGGHPIHERRTQKLLRGLVYARQLNRHDIAVPGGPGLVIVDATEPGEETMARAWCAEVGRNAVVRKGGRGCLACAVDLAEARAGLNFDTLIWCT